MPDTPFQPALPVEGVLSEAELSFMEDEPPGLFPENQNSNFGYIIRKLFCDRIQILIEQQTTAFNERFVNTAEQFLDEHERMVGLPTDTSRSLVQRRQDVLTRLDSGAFTRDKRNAIIEKYITATFGEAVQLTPAGVPLVAGGVPLYSGETGNVTLLYAVVENIASFSYEVRIKDTITPDTAALTRELLRITPAGITFTIVFVPTP